MKKLLMKIFGKFIPEIQIHCWGGLGSQLYAVALKIDLERQFPGRTFRLVSHEAGVTLRKSELESFFPNSVNSVQDFTSSESKIYRLLLRDINKLIRRLISFFLYSFSFIVDGDKAEGIRHLRFWTFQIRGHYSLRKLEIVTLKEILGILIRVNSSNLQLNRGNEIVVHYRLGDLQSLDNKSPINNLRVADVIKKVQNEVKTGITLMSDSPEIAEDLLTKSGIEKISMLDLGPVETLQSLISSRYFVGTNSKLSVWSVILNLDTTHRLKSFLPIELKHHIDANIGNIKGLTFY